MRRPATVPSTEAIGPGLPQPLGAASAGRWPRPPPIPIALVPRALAIQCHKASTGQAQSRRDTEREGEGPVPCRETGPSPSRRSGPGLLHPVERPGDGLLPEPVLLVSLRGVHLGRPFL